MDTDQRQQGPPSAPGAPYSHEVAFELLMREYSSLKAEQTARIGFRDNLIFVTLGAIGAVFTYTLEVKSQPNALLVIPWIAFILGWTYLVNDHHISRIGRYIREDLREQLYRTFPMLGTHAPQDTDKEKQNLLDAFRWEPFHRNDTLRTSRKRIQRNVDFATFALAPSVAILVFLTQVKSVSAVDWFLIAGGITAILTIAIQIWAYSDTDQSETIPL